MQRTFEAIKKRLLVELNSLPFLPTEKPNQPVMKAPPEWLGRSGNFYSAASHAVQNIGPCIGVCVTEDGNVWFGDAQDRWWPKYIPHTKPKGT